MVIKTPESRVGIGLGHDECRRAMTTADIRNLASGFEFFLNSGECGNPRGNKVRRIAGAEETLRADKEIRIVFAPEDPAAILKRVLNARDGMRHCFDHIEPTADKERARFIC